MLLFQWCQMDKCTECTFNSWLLGISGEKISYKYKLRKTGSGQHSILKKPEVTIFHIADVQFWQVYGAGQGVPSSSRGILASPRGPTPSSRGIPSSPRGIPAERGVHPWFSQSIANQFLPVFSLAIVEDGIVTWHICRVNPNTPKWETSIKTN